MSWGQRLAAVMVVVSRIHASHGLACLGIVSHGAGSRLFWQLWEHSENATGVMYLCHKHSQIESLHTVFPVFGNQLTKHAEIWFN